MHMANNPYKSLAASGFKAGRKQGGNLEEVPGAGNCDGVGKG